jgi:hypothetical protein
MKKAILFVTLLLSGFLFKTANAQIEATMKMNIGIQPVWGPVGHNYVEYYYLPDIDVYYDVFNHQYVYMEDGKWIFAEALPSRFSSFDINTAYKVVLNERKPYRHADANRTKYAAYKGQHDQPIMRNSHEAKYFEIKDHPEHDKWVKDHPKNDGDKN